MIKSLLITCGSMLLLLASCEKDSTDITPPVEKPSITGNWNLVSQSDTLFYGEEIKANTLTASTDLYGSINFQADGTVYTTMSFMTGTAVNGSELFIVAQRIIPVRTDTSKYTIDNNVITITPKYGSSYKDTIAVIDNHNLVLSNFVTSIWKKTWHYSK